MNLVAMAPQACLSQGARPSARKRITAATWRFSGSHSRRWACLLALVREETGCESCFQRFFAERISGTPRLAATAADGKSDEVTFQATVGALRHLPCMPKRWQLAVGRGVTPVLEVCMVGCGRAGHPANVA